MTSTDHQQAHHRGAVDELVEPRFDGPAPKSISSDRLLRSLKEAASWPGSDRNTVVILALSLVAARADAEGSSYFQDLSERNPADATAQALAGFFQIRAGHDLAAAVTKLDRAATTEPGLPQYFRGLALAELLPGEGASGTELAAADTARADQVIADLEFVLAARDQFPVLLLRAAHQGLARAYGALGRHQQAVDALRRSGVGSAATGRPPTFTSFSLTARDGLRLSAPGTLSPAPNVHVAQSYDFADFAFINTTAGVVAIDAGTTPDRVLSAMSDLGLADQAPVSHLILTHAHFDHIGGAAAVRGPDTEVIASATFPAEAERLRRYVPPELIGTSARPDSDVEPARLISERTSLVVGDTEFVLIPVRGGETPDALMVYLPASGVLFAGDVLMPYVGVPFFAEGSPEGLLDTLRYIRGAAASDHTRASSPTTSSPLLLCDCGSQSSCGQRARSSSNPTVSERIDRAVAEYRFRVGGAVSRCASNGCPERAWVPLSHDSCNSPESGRIEDSGRHRSPLQRGGLGVAAG